MDNNGDWWFYKTKPIKCSSVWFGRDGLRGEEQLSSSFNIKRARKWQDSLIKVEHKEEE